MKKGQIAVLFLALLVGLCACTPKAPATPAAAPSASVEKADVSTLEAWGAHIKSKYNGEQINLLVGANPGIEAMQKMVQDFEALTGIKLNFRVITDATLKNIQLTEAAGGAGNYDIFAVDAASVPEFHGKKLLVPLEPYLNDKVKTPVWFDYDDFLPSYSKGISRSQGVIVGIPYAGETRLIGYRTDLFEKYNKKPPRTMDEYLELARFFNGREPGIYGVSMRGASGRQGGSGYQSIAYAFTDAAFVNAKTFEPEFDSPDTIAAFRFYVELLKNAPPDVTTYSNQETHAAFMTGKTAMWLDASSQPERFSNPAISAVAGKVDFVPTPIGPKGKSAALAGWNLAIPIDSKKKDVAWALIVYMTSREMAKTYVGHGGIPCRTSIYTDPELVAKYRTFPKVLEAMEHALALIERGISYNPDFTYTNDMMAFAGTYLSKAMIGELTVEEAARQCQLEALEFLEDR